MAGRKTKIVFVCQNCGYESARWAGRCPACGEWNTFAEEKIEPGRKEIRTRKDKRVAIRLAEVRAEKNQRMHSNSPEFDRVLGGGLVPGSLVLLGGDPGIGKSTLLLQRMADYARSGCTVLYVAGEESLEQVRMRADRLGIDEERLWIFPETDVLAVREEVERLEPAVVAVDSIQTMYHPDYESAPGSVTQVRECAARFLELAKSQNVAIFLIGHVTKEGAIAGPRVLEHMVDALLFLEGDRQYQYRILRAIKNRFGSTNEVGIFELRGSGMVEVKNPSQLFLSDYRQRIAGAAVTCTLEGTRPILLEVQALTTSASFGMPQRTAAGIDHKRLALLLAILEKRGGIQVATADVFVKIAGGLRIDDPAADLAILMAIASAHRNTILEAEALFLGEVGLGGEIRAVSQLEKRLKEAEQLGFAVAYVPRQKMDQELNLRLSVVEIKHISEALEVLR